MTRTFERGLLEDLHGVQLVGVGRRHLAHQEHLHPGTGEGEELVSRSELGTPGTESSAETLSYLAEGSLAQHLEQLELGGVSLLRALLDHVGDVDLLDVSIFLQKQEGEADQKGQIQKHAGFVFFLTETLQLQTALCQEKRGKR